MTVVKGTEHECEQQIGVRRDRLFALLCMQAKHRYSRDEVGKLEALKNLEQSLNLLDNTIAGDVVELPRIVFPVDTPTYETPSQPLGAWFWFCCLVENLCSGPLNTVLQSRGLSDDQRNDYCWLHDSVDILVARTRDTVLSPLEVILILQTILHLHFHARVWPRVCNCYLLAYRNFDTK